MLGEAAQERVVAIAVDRVVQRQLAGTTKPNYPTLDEILIETLYNEGQRLAREPDSERAEIDRAFHARLRREIAGASPVRLQALLREVVTRYATEIRGHFDPKVYAVATRALPLGLTGLLNGLSPTRMARRLPHLSNVDQNVLLTGEVDALRTLVNKGTVILAPTHSSNLDSLLMGYAIYRMGLPPFAYGAGLNLFTSPITSFFMRNLGAYTVDRSKTDPLYRETLKEYATVMMESGQHNLFFAGGTRSRSGAVERRLKKGLLGTGLTAYRNNLLAGRTQPRVFVFPCTGSYPLVLEAASLIENYLQHEGRAHYITAAEDEFGRVHRWLDFLGGLMAMDMRIHVNVGSPLDPFGNDVDQRGDSHDPRGRPIDPARYLLVQGQVAADDARDAEYTRILAERMLATYRRDNVALPTSVLAFAFLERIRRAARQPDLFRFLRSLGPETRVPRELVHQEVASVIGELSTLAGEGRIQLDPVVRAGDVRALVDHALGTFGTYHTTPVIKQRGAFLHVGDANLMFYYRNRLEGYGLRDAPPLVPDGDRS